jgi:hypothetical protein
MICVIEDTNEITPRLQCENTSFTFSSFSDLQIDLFDAFLVNIHRSSNQGVSFIKLIKGIKKRSGKKIIFVGDIDSTTRDYYLALGVDDVITPDEVATFEWGQDATPKRSIESRDKYPTLSLKQLGNQARQFLGIMSDVLIEDYLEKSFSKDQIVKAIGDQLSDEERRLFYLSLQPYEK